MDLNAWKDIIFRRFSFNTNWKSISLRKLEQSTRSQIYFSTAFTRSATFWSFEERAGGEARWWKRRKKCVFPSQALYVRPCRNQAVCRNRAQCVNTRVPRFTQSACTSVRACKPLFIDTTKTKYKWKSRKVEGQEESTLRPQFSAAP